MPRPDDQGVVVRLHADHVQRLRRGDAQAAPLTHGVKRQTLMLAEHLAGGIDDWPRSKGFRLQPRPQKRPVIAAGNETDLLALRLRCHLEAELRGHVPHLLLAEVAERKQGVTELLLGQIEEEIRLVLAGIPAAADVVPAVVSSHHAGVMAGGHAAGAKLLRPLLQGGEFQVAVALRAGVGGVAALVGGNEVVDDVPGERLLEVGHVKGDAQLTGDPPRIGNVVQRAAGLVMPLDGFRAVPQLHGDADALVPLGVQQGGAYRTVNAAAHRHNHALAHGDPFAGVRKESCVLP